MYANPEAPQAPQVAWSSAPDKPPASWWLAATLGVPVFNVVALYGIVAALSSLAIFGTPVLGQLWWMPAMGILALEYVGFRKWGSRRGFGRGWALTGAGMAFALGVVYATVVLFIALADCNGCLS